MLGSKEIRDFTPEKAVFGGYDTRSVDMMLDQAADDMEALERENAELRAKLKVMVDKIEEYRRIESGIRQALMTAQGMADKTKKKRANRLTRREIKHTKRRNSSNGKPKNSAKPLSDGIRCRLLRSRRVCGWHRRKQLPLLKK